MAVKLTESWQKIIRIDECRIVVLSFVNSEFFEAVDKFLSPFHDDYNVDLLEGL